MRRSKHHTLAAALLALAGSTGCSSSSQSTAAPAASQGGEATPAAPSGSAAQAPSDEEIISIVTIIDNAEIEQGRLALEKAQSPRVREYATAMIEKHTASKDEAAQIAATNELTPETSALSSELQAKGADTLQTLRATEPAAFDRAYIQAQVQQHREFLDLLDQRLLPNADNEALLHELQAIRDSVREHLKHAQDLAANAS